MGLFDLEFTYDTYQDVRKNLFKYFTPVCIVAGFFTYFLILPIPARALVTALLGRIQANPFVTGTVGTLTGIAVFIGLAFLLVEVFQLHDQVYDTYFVKWRRPYDRDFIIPRLVRPFASKVGARFYEEADQDLRKFMDRLFYHFVRDRDTKIPKNTLVRFY